MQPSPTKPKKTVNSDVYFALYYAVKAWLIRTGKIEQDHAQKHNPILPVRHLQK